MTEHRAEPKRRGRPRREHAVHKMLVTLHEHDYDGVRRLAAEEGVPPTTFVQRLVEREVRRSNPEDVPVLLWLPPDLLGEVMRGTRKATPKERVLAIIRKAVGLE